MEHGFYVSCKKVFCEGSTYIFSSLTLVFPLDRSVKLAVYRSGCDQAQLDITVESKLINI